MIYNITVSLSFEADNSEEAEEKAYNALSLIPMQNAPSLYEIITIYAPEGQGKNENVS